MIVRTAAVVLSGMLGAGCVYEPQAAYPEAEPEAACPAQAVETVHTFSLTSGGGDVLMARVDGADIVGSDMSLARFDEGRGGAIRGHAVGRLVNLEAGGGRVTGLVSGGPMELSVARDAEGALVVEGLVRGRISAFRVDAAAVRGTIGRCSYELWRSGFEYEGRRSCGGPTARVSLRVPEALEHWSDDERMAVIAILLDRG